jgi:ribosomal protein S26
VKKVLRLLRGPVDSADAAATGRKASIKTENKLVRCVACGTWIPADRAIGAGSKLSEYCSRECLEKSATGKERKLAG